MISNSYYKGLMLCPGISTRYASSIYSILLTWSITIELKPLKIALLYYYRNELDKIGNLNSNWS